MRLCEYYLDNYLFDLSKTLTALTREIGAGRYPMIVDTVAAAYFVALRLWQKTQEL